MCHHHCCRVSAGKSYKGLNRHVKPYPCKVPKAKDKEMPLPARDLNTVKYLYPTTIPVSQRLKITPVPGLVVFGQYHAIQPSGYGSINGLLRTHNATGRGRIGVHVTVKPEHFYPLTGVPCRLTALTGSLNNAGCLYCMYRSHLRACLHLPQTTTYLKQPCLLQNSLSVLGFIMLIPRPKLLPGKKNNPPKRYKQLQRHKCCTQGMYTALGNL
ncbi:hypothetical protein MBAV_003001 [Candidatus Magnetobacterium bavaricum]|uniref:Uncharacterized protein n=1 Tax=Candidatus Magnetobacterium bavaricum TaxID=29290 RepID=A0A0F3GSG6_9BACT|nr:hypothetical protein MBAV_003001 [Candidatus Magnetobacterium bavaricum]